MPNDERKSLKDLLEENIIASDNEEIVELKITDIEPNPYQPRREFDEQSLQELAQSILEHGIISPILVKKQGNSYVIVAGERRYRASKLAGLATIPAVIRPYEKEKIIELALIENLQRENLSPLDEAEAYELMMKELSYTQAQVAKKVGKSRSYITNQLGILNMPEEVKNLLRKNKISFGHARALSKLSDKNRMIDLAHLVVMKSLSVRELEELVKNEDKKNVQKKRESNKKIYMRNVGSHKVKIVSDDKKIVIKAKDSDQLQDILKWLMED